MGKKSLGDFLKGGKKGEFLNLKEKKRATVFIHPEQGFFCLERHRHTIPIVKINKDVGYDGEEKIIKKQGLLFLNCFDEWNQNNNRITLRCPVCNLVQNLRENEDIPMDEVIFQLNLGKSKVEYLKGEIIGDSNFDFKKSSVVRMEYITSVVTLDGEQRILIAPKTLGDAIRSEIENRVQEEGEEEGNPLVTPYPLTLKYNEGEQAMKRYSAHYSPKTINAEVEAAFKASPLSLDYLLKLSSMKEIKDVLKGITLSKYWKFFLVGDEEVEDEEEETSKINTKEKLHKKILKKKKLKALKKKSVVEMEPCLACKKLIPKDAMKCQYCGTEFTEDIPDEENGFFDEEDE